MNQVGIGNIGLKGIVPPQAQPGPPFTSDSAENGLSVDPVTGRIVFGQDGPLAAIGPAELLSDRVVPMGAFSIAYFDAAGNTLFHDASFLEMETFGQATELHLDNAGFITILGNDTLSPKTPFISFQDDSLALSDVWLLRNLAGIFSIENNNTADRLLALSYSTLGAVLGDVDNSGGGTKLFIDDPNLSATIETTAGPMLQLLQSGGAYLMGDIGLTAGGLIFFLDDTNLRALIQAGAGNRMLDLDQVNGSYQIGDIDIFANGLKLALDDTNSRAIIDNNAGAIFDVDQQGQRYRIGDIGGTGSGNVFEIDDAASTFIIDNGASNAGILINGVAGFTGTVAPPLTITVNNGIVTNVA